MNKFKQIYPKLYKYYNKELKKCHKINFTNISNNLDYFSTYLRYMRDYYLLLLPNNADIASDIRLASLCTAVAEYEMYTTCITKYYDIDAKNIAKPKDSTKSKDEIILEYQKERSQHWHTFWVIVEQYIESWMNLDDFTI